MSLPSSKLVQAWLPRLVDRGSDNDHDHPEDNGSQIPRSFFWFLVVGIPIIVVVITSLSIWGCVSCCKARRRLKRPVVSEPMAASTALIEHRAASPVTKQSI